MSDVSQIDGNAVRLRRESQGWALSDLATRACLSVKQVRQIEEGGMTAFYSETVKLTAARKLAGLLEMSESQLFGQHLAMADNLADPTHQDALEAESAAYGSPDLSNLGGGLNAQNTPFTRSEVLHILAQPPEHVEVGEVSEANSPALAAAEPPAATEPAASVETSSPAAKVDPDAAAEPAQSAEVEEAASSGGYFLKILALFVVALAAAALLKPSIVEDKPAAPAAEAPAIPMAPVPNPAENAPVAQPAAATDSKPVEAKPAALEIKPASAAPAADNTTGK